MLAHLALAPAAAAVAELAREVPDLAPLAAQRQLTLESLLGMSESDDDDDGAARFDAELAASAKVTRPAVLPGLAGMPPLRAL